MKVAHEDHVTCPRQHTADHLRYDIKLRLRGGGGDDDTLSPANLFIFRSHRRQHCRRRRRRRLRGFLASNTRNHFCDVTASECRQASARMCSNSSHDVTASEMAALCVYVVCGGGGGGGSGVLGFFTLCKLRSKEFVLISDLR